MEFTCFRFGHHLVSRSIFATEKISRLREFINNLQSCCKSSRLFIVIRSGVQWKGSELGVRWDHLPTRGFESFIRVSLGVRFPFVLNDKVCLFFHENKMARNPAFLKVNMSHRWKKGHCDLYFYIRKPGPVHTFTHFQVWLMNRALLDPKNN